MAEPNENVAYLAQSIGPRPAGTEEEQQAALYITEQIQADSGLAAVIEDFNCSPDHDLPRAALVAVSLLVALLALFLQVMTVPALIISLLSAILFVTEALGKTSLSKLLGNGVSQNVVAKYVPAATEDAGAPRRRKVILVAHYDSGKVRKDLSARSLAMSKALQVAGFAGMCAIPVILLIKTIVTFGGAALVFVNVVMVAAMICAAIPLVGVIANRAAAYNEAANCNAAGVAVLMEVARRVGRGSNVVSTSEPRKRSKRVEVHGEEAAREAGLVPEEAELVYEVESTSPVASPDISDAPEGSPEARLLSAKAAIAALTGKPVSNSVSIRFEEATQAEDAAGEGSLEIDADEAAEAARESTEGSSATSDAVLAAEAGESEDENRADQGEDAHEEPSSSEVPSSASARNPEVPAWFKSAQEKARKPVGAEAPIRRSRYADALDAAARESAARAEAEAEAASRAAVAATEDRLRQMRESIMEARLSAAEKAAAAASEQAADATALETVAGADALAAGAASVAAPLAEGVEAVAANGASQLQSGADAEKPVAPAAQRRPSVRKKRAIALPSIGKGSSDAVANEVSGVEGAKADGKTSAIRNLRAKLPSIGGLSDRENSAASNAAKLAGLPTLDAASSGPASVSDDDTAGVVAAGIAENHTNEAYGQDDLGATQMFEPYSQEDLRGFEDEMELVIQGAESAADHDEVGALDGFEDRSNDLPAVEEALAAAETPRENRSVSRETRRAGYSSMPKSRIQGFLSRFSRDGERRSVRDEHVTPQEWLDVDKDFDARSAGAARGGWESFRQDSESEAAYGDPNRRYSGELEAAFSDDADDFSSARRKRRWEGGSASREQLGRVSMLSGYEEEAEQQDVSYHGDENIYRFRHPDIDVEVWFVALGSELAANGGMNAFMAEHAADLKGALFVELEGLGAGDLAVVESEGLYRTCSSPSRMRRYAAKASAELGVPLGRASINWRDTSSAFAMQRGYQALHLIGTENGKPARYGQEDDVFECVDEETMMRNADFVMELLKQI